VSRICQTFARIQGSNSSGKGGVYLAQLEFPSLLPKNNPAVPKYSFQSIDIDIINNTNSFVSISSILSSTLLLHNNINNLPVINTNLGSNNDNHNNNHTTTTNNPNSLYQYPTVKKSFSYIISLNCANNLQPTGNMQHVALKH
jgi:hypothetical protein